MIQNLHFKNWHLKILNFNLSWYFNRKLTQLLKRFKMGYKFNHILYFFYKFDKWGFIKYLYEKLCMLYIYDYSEFAINREI